MSGHYVVDGVGVAGDTADGEVGVEEGIGWALLANTSNQVVAGDADTVRRLVERVGVRTLSCRNGKGLGANSGESGSRSESIQHNSSEFGKVGLWWVWDLTCFYIR